MRRGIVAVAAALLVSPLASGVAQAAPLVHLGPIHIVHQARGRAQSTNWAGYASTGATFKKVVGTWTQPSVNCSTAPNGIVAFWVGLDGYNSSTVEQDGTIAICSGGSPSYYDWWEMYPTNAVQLVHSISAGDVVTGSVSFSGGTYTLSVTDATHSGDSFTTHQSCSGGCSRNSAEWIAEAPCCQSGRVYPMPDFGKEKFKKASATNDAGHKGTINDNAWTAVSITMVNGSGQTKVSTSSLNASGNAFSCTWQRAQRA
jgi:hypothetical protein